MKRYLCWFALGVVITAPAVAGACWPMWGGRFAYSRPMFAGPRFSAPPPIYAAAPMYTAPIHAAPLPNGCLPAAPGQPLPPPRIESLPKTATPSAAPAPGMGSAIPDPMPPLAKPSAAPVVEQVRPAGGNGGRSDAPPLKVDPAAPNPAENSRDPALTYPKVEIPKNLRSEPKLPPLELPKEPDLTAVPKVPAVGASKESVIPAIPSAAPPPESLIPPSSVPSAPDPTRRDPLPSLTLPPEVPVAPEKKADTISRSSPLTNAARGMTVSVFAARGAEEPTTGYRTVGFYNHTANDLALTIEGRAVKLPAKSYLQAQLAASFTWSHGDRAAAREVVPEGAGGLDVVFRE
jgi:hypothetical protein